jgi:hypothetical protein
VSGGEAAPVNLWPVLAGQRSPESLPAEAAGAAARRLSAFVPAQLVRHLLGDAAPADLAEAAERGRLTARYLRARHAAALRALTAADVPAAAFKGYAAAFDLYPDPDLRLAGDLDVLVPRARVPAAVEALARLDLHPAEMPTAAWGFIGRVSYLPIVDRTGLVNVDLHVEADEYPLPRALPADAVLARAHWHANAGAKLPGRGDHALILISHSARDRLGPAAVKRMLDVARLLPSGPQPADWAAVWALAEPGLLRKPVAVTLALLAELEVDTGPLPPGLAEAVARRRRTRAVRAAARRWRALFPGGERGRLAKLADEALLAAEPPVLAYRQWERVRGLIRPASGRPPAPEGRGATTPRGTP